MLLPMLQQLYKATNAKVSDVFLEHFTVYGLSKMPGQTKAEKTYEKLTTWFKGEISYIEINILGIENLMVRLYQSGFNREGKEITIHSDSAIAFYSRARTPYRKHAVQTKICDLSAGKKLESTIDSHLAAITTQKATYQNGRNIHTSKPIPTLGEYLPEYQNLKYRANPKTAVSKIQLVEKHFSNLLSTPINQVNKSHLQAWLATHTVKLSSKELNSGMSHYDLAESTLKGAMCTLRAAIRSASEDPRHPFVFDKGLLCNSLKIRVNNVEIKYYTDSEIAEIYKNLIARDQEKLKGKVTRSSYADYFTPLTLLCFYTGLRPSYALKITRRDINFDDKKLRISATIGKIKENFYIELCPQIEAVLKEWLKHSCHRTTSTQWLFPSTKSKGAHIVSYKKTQSRFRKRLSFAHFDFRIIRHTFATIFTKQTNDIFQTKKALMHGDIISTMRYAHHIMDKFNNELGNFGANLANLLAPK